MHKKNQKKQTIFALGKFNLSPEHSSSLLEMEEQAKGMPQFSYHDTELVKLNQYNIHKCGTVLEAGMRAFFKLSFSPDRYDLIGNAHNNLLDYNCKCIPVQSREITRCLAIGINTQCNGK